MKRYSQNQIGLRSKCTANTIWQLIKVLTYRRGKGSESASEKKFDFQSLSLIDIHKLQTIGGPGDPYWRDVRWYV